MKEGNSLLHPLPTGERTKVRGKTPHLLGAGTPLREGNVPKHRKRKTAPSHRKRVNQPSHIERVAKKSVR